MISARPVDPSSSLSFFSWHINHVSCLFLIRQVWHGVESTV
jgi:hypothetical protein